MWPIYLKRGQKFRATTLLYKKLKHSISMDFMPSCKHSRHEFESRHLVKKLHIKYPVTTCPSTHKMYTINNNYYCICTYCMYTVLRYGTAWYKLSTINVQTGIVLLLNSPVLISWKIYLMADYSKSMKQKLNVIGATHFSFICKD